MDAVLKGHRVAFCIDGPGQVKGAGVAGPRIGVFQCGGDIIARTCARTCAAGAVARRGRHGVNIAEHIPVDPRRQQHTAERQLVRIFAEVVQGVHRLSRVFRADAIVVIGAGVAQVVRPVIAVVAIGVLVSKLIVPIDIVFEVLGASQGVPLLAVLRDPDLARFTGPVAAVATGIGISKDLEVHAVDMVRIIPNGVLEIPGDIAAVSTQGGGICPHGAAHQRALRVQAIHPTAGIGRLTAIGILGAGRDIIDDRIRQSLYIAGFVQRNLNGFANAVAEGVILRNRQNTGATDCCAGARQIALRDRITILVDFHQILRLVFDRPVKLYALVRLELDCHFLAIRRDNSGCLGVGRRKGRGHKAAFGQLQICKCHNIRLEG